METVDSEDWVFDLEMTSEHTGPDGPVHGHDPLNETVPTNVAVAPLRVVSGTQLRRRLITPEALEAMAQERPKPSLLQRLLQRLLRRS